jgi:hypothetical protein
VYQGVNRAERFLRRKHFVRAVQPGLTEVVVEGKHARREDLRQVRIGMPHPESSTSKKTLLSARPVHPAQVNSRHP